MEIIIFALGCGIPALFLWLFSKPKRWETEQEWGDRVSSMSFRGDSRRQKVPEHGYAKRTTKRKRRA